MLSFLHSCVSCTRSNHTVITYRDTLQYDNIRCYPTMLPYIDWSRCISLSLYRDSRVLVLMVMVIYLHVLPEYCPVPYRHRRPATRYRAVMVEEHVLSNYNLRIYPPLLTIVKLNLSLNVDEKGNSNPLPNIIL